MPALRATALSFLALIALAGAAALIANRLAAPARRLAWTGSVVVAPMAAPPAPPPAVPAPPAPPAALPADRDLRPSRPATPTTRAELRAPGQVQASVASSPIRDITSAEAWQAFQAGLPFLDARRSAEYAEGHVARAWCAPVWEADLDDRLLAFKAARRPGPEDPIVIYCSGGDCRDSHLLAAKLLNEGYGHLLIYRDGYPDWANLGHPVEKGLP